MSTVVRVVGDGPAGAAAATAAARRGLPARLSGRGRVHPRGTLEILSGRAGAALTELGWYAAVVERATPCEEIVSCWGSDRYVARPAMLEPSGLGWIVDRAWFDPLVRRLAGAAGVDLTGPGSEEPTVLATGKHAAGSRRALGPRLIAFTLVLASGAVDGLGPRLLVEAAPDGWWTAVDDGESTCLSYTVPHRGDDTCALRETWHIALRQGPAWLPAYADWPDPRVRPVRSHVALGDPPVRRVGDAALSVDPLSGHGLTLALEGALRCLDDDYPDWLQAQAEDHARAARAAYELGGYDPEVWAGALS